MSKSYFFKHLPCTLHKGLVHRSFSLYSISNFKPICRYKSKHNSSLFSKIPNFSFFNVHYCTSLTASLDTSTTTDSSAYLSVRIRCPIEVSDKLSEALLCFGASSASVNEQDDCDNSSEICIESIFPERQDVEECLSKAADSIGLKEIPTYEVEIGEQYDWIKKTQESFHPVEVSEGLWIVPEWRSPLDARATNIILNPGLAFGTGEHPTTKLCLLLLRGLIKGGERFLDYGTGSGILGIAAVKFGASLSVGFDIDLQAITSARHNAVLNNIGPETMELFLIPSNLSYPIRNDRTDEVVKAPNSHGMGLASETEKYDVVIANILLNPLLELADHIVSYARPGAVVGLSGILCEQLSYIMDRYSVLLEDVSVSEMEGWVCVSGRKKNNLDRR